MKALLVISFILSGCTWHNYWDLKCNGYIETHKILKADRYINLNYPFVAYELGGGDSLVFTNYGGNISQHFHSYDTLGDYKAAHSKISTCNCK